MALCACGAAPDKLISDGEIIGDEIPAALTSLPGVAREGQRVFSEREAGHCVLCHVVDGLETPFQGNVGPDLSDVGNRLTDAQLRLRIVDYQIVRPGTLMPSYYRTHDLYQVSDAYEAAPILTAQEVEHLVTYLSALKVDERNDD